VYSDPKHIRKHRISITLTDVERRAIEAIAELNGTHPATFVREVVLAQLQCPPVPPSDEPK
jgi:hypothetical protein